MLDVLVAGVEGDRDPVFVSLSIRIGAGDGKAVVDARAAEARGRVVDADRGFCEFAPLTCVSCAIALDSGQGLNGVFGWTQAIQLS